MKTRREKIIKFLSEHDMTLQELADLLGVSVKTVVEDLESVRKTIKFKDGSRIEVRPASCFKCGYVFSGRNRISDPHKCPKCHSERINPQSFRISSI